jgi:hypothetical protein
LISIGCGPRDLSSAPENYQVAHLDLDSSRPELSWKHRPGEKSVLDFRVLPVGTTRPGPPVPGDVWAAWQAMAMRLFAELV